MQRVKTTTIDTGLIKDLKARHPIPAELVTSEYTDLVVKIKDLETKEAVNIAFALNMLHLLQQYREMDKAQ